MKIAIGQINTIPSDFENNLLKIKRYTEEAIRNGTDIIIFPELALSGYMNQDIIYTPEFIAATRRHLKQIEKLSDRIAIIIGHISQEKKIHHFNRRDLSSRRFGGNYTYFNSASVFFERKKIFEYHKQRLPSFDIFNEERYFAVKEQKQTFNFKGQKIGINICEDIWFENGPYEQQAAERANIIINISASPFYVGKPEIRFSMIRDKVKRYGVFTVYANSVGGQDELIYDGNSFVFSPKGLLLSKGKAFDEELIIADTDSETYINPVFEKYSMISGGIVLAIRDYFCKNGIKKAIIGLSGGIDSALVSTLCKIALGDENIINIFMPSDYTSGESKRLVKDFIKRQKTELITIPVSDTYKTLKSVLKDYSKNTFLPFENLQSRIRGNILMFMANSFDGAVVATGNKNEIALGYNTLYGDTVGALAPIGDLYKDEITDLSKHINVCYGNIIPDEIIRRIPTAELRKNQKDEDDLPPYSVTNRLLPEMIENNKTDDELIKMGFDRKTIDFVHRSIKRSEFKRRQMPPIVKLKPKSFGFGRRVPITHKFPFSR
ncbi:MAG: NAD+ synthase [Deltaproteobacteria bacterium]|nr:NAD+ synthase [Deltaproteobacteria bacterium]